MKRPTLIVLLVSLGVFLFAAPSRADMDKKEAIHLKDQSLKRNRLDLYDLRSAAHGGDLWAENEYGIFLVQSGRDSARGLVWIRKAAKHGLPVAQRNMGSFYARGLVVRQNFPRAAQWFRPAAVAGDWKAQYYLGILYARGWGVRKDPLQALMWFRKSVLHGNPAPAYEIGRFYREGRGVSQDYLKAIKWFREAAIKNYAPAEKALATAYTRGEGVPKDPTLAQKWYQKSLRIKNGADEFLVEWDID